MGECREITLAEILADPIVLMVMAADGINPAEFESNLRAAGRGPRVEQDADGGAVGRAGEPAPAP
jgi:hypothetical protein